MPSLVNEQPVTCAAQDAAVLKQRRRRYAFTPEGQYILDCAVELGDITPMEAMTFTADTPAAIAYDRIGELNEGLPRHWLRNTAREYLNGCEQETRYVWALYGLESTQFAVQMLSEQMEFVVRQKVQRDLGQSQGSSLIEKLHLNNGVLEGKRFDTVHAITRENVSAYLREQFSEAIQRIELDVQLAKEALEWAQDPKNRQRARKIATRLFAAVNAHREQERMEALSLETLDQFCPVQKVKHRGARHQARALVRQARRAIKKATRLLDSMGHGHTVRLLVNGETARISHPDSPFYFEVTPSGAGWLVRNTIQPGGHVPYTLSVYSKRGKFLTRLCVVFENTPVLDQLLALALYVQSGQESEILMQANWFGYENATRLRQFLGRWAPQYLEKVPALRHRGNSQQGMVAHFERYHAEERQWEPYRRPVQTWIQEWCRPLSLSIQALMGEPSPNLSLLVSRW